MSPLFIMKPESGVDDPSPPTPSPPPPLHYTPPERSTPEGQEPDRTNDRCDLHDTDDQPIKRDKHFPRRRSTTLPHHHRYSLLSDTGNSYSCYRTTPVPPQPRSSSALRKYVLLVQDCVAIKFVRKQGSGGEEPPLPRPSVLSPSEKYSTPPPDKLLRYTLDGAALFKSFTSCNKKCYWNPSLSECISSLEYKGCIHPSTILVTTSTRHMNVLRNAWSRRILQNPPGFTTELLGEVEELVAQPVQQGQFAPLSDSLCWTISELTESGEEAFIDSIQSKLHTAFPSISQPPKELIFQTLEKLIREQKIYQTSHGYYIVTPDISTFVRYSRAVSPAPSSSYSHYTRIHDYFEKPAQSRYSTPWSSTPSVTNNMPPSSEDLLKHLVSCPANNLLKRHNSLKIIRNKHESTYQMHNHPTMGARSLSFRLSKCNSLFESDKDTDDDEEEDQEYRHESTRYSSPPQVYPPGNVSTTATQTSHKKRLSFLSRLFTFRCSTTGRAKRNSQDPTMPRNSSPEQHNYGLTPTVAKEPPSAKRPSHPKTWSSSRRGHRATTTTTTTSTSSCSSSTSTRVPRGPRTCTHRPLVVSSPCSSVSGIYASIRSEHRNTIREERVTRCNSNVSSKSLYDLQSCSWRNEAALQHPHLSDDLSR